MNILALLPYMTDHFDEPDEFCITCAANIVQVSFFIKRHCLCIYKHVTVLYFLSLGVSSNKRSNQSWKDVQYVCRQVLPSSKKHMGRGGL